MTVAQATHTRSASALVIALRLWVAVSVALVAGLWAGGVAGLRLGPIELSPGWIDVLAPLSGMGVAVLLLQRRGARACLRHVVAATRARLAPASPLRRAQLLGAACLTAAALNSALAAPVEALRLRVSQASSRFPSLTHNADNTHLPALLSYVAGRSDHAPVVVHVDDEDPRAHLAAYYAYPRLLLMAPARRAWTTRMRMDRLGVPDPVLPPTGPAPALTLSEQFALERRTELLVLRGRRLLRPSEPSP